MTIRPLDDRIVVKLLPNKSNGGLIAVPDCAQGKRDEFGRGANGPLRGMIVTLGPGRRGSKGGRIPIEAKIGDIILFSGLSDWEGMDGEDALMMIREKDIIVMEKTDA